jgi:hypothetical protein
VTIAVIGDFDNLYHLLLSEPDTISPLSGSALISQSVAELAIQAAAFGESFNLYNHNATFAETVLNNWPSDVNLTLIGSNIGSKTYFGARLTTELDLSVNPVAYAFNKSVGYNVTHKTWDATALYYAVRGLDDVYAFNFTHGVVVADSKATTSWNFESNSTRQNAVVWSEDGIGNVTFAERLEDILLWQPGEAIPENLRRFVGCESNVAASNVTVSSSGTGAVLTASASYIPRLRRRRLDREHL